MAQTFLQLARRVQEKRTGDDLHAVQWAALRYLARAGRRTATVQGLARYLSNTSGSASRTIKSLQERGLVEGVPLREDARSTSYALTAFGEETLGRDPLLELAAAVSTLEPARVAKLADLLDQVQAALERQRE